MSADDVGNLAEAEIRALTTIVQALRGLSVPDQRRIIDAALVLLGSSPLPRRSGAGDKPLSDRATTGDDPPPADVRQLTELKKPESANEMAALVAYYLSEVAETDERKTEVEISDMQKYFKQARFRLPASPAMTLVHAKNAGYFDAVGGGRYKLNPVGYNLVAHTLPRASTGGDRKARRKPKRTTPKRSR